ncbi:hypothetical protein V7122_24715 [Bacillus sp. JJ1532]|uniref:hypothetical protein n=1 Tax=Bacillus sp. JJ1532 TaxID=3122958 RepID=UPI002FFFF4F1
MIVKVKVINQPLSGEYKERVYDISSPWNSQSWSWIKFTNENSTEWCGILVAFLKVLLYQVNMKPFLS